jgi:hypothetical protein
MTAVSLIAPLNHHEFLWGVGGRFLKSGIRQRFKKPVVGIVWYCFSMTKFIDETEHYYITDNTHMCCDESQFTYICKSCDETMDCYYCGFDYDDPHGCDKV